MTCKGICIKHKAALPDGSNRYATGQDRRRGTVYTQFKVSSEDSNTLKQSTSEILENNNLFRIDDRKIYLKPSRFL